MPESFGIKRISMFEQEMNELIKTGRLTGFLKNILRVKADVPSLAS